MSVVDNVQAETDRFVASVASGADPGEWLATFIRDAGLAEPEAIVVITVVTRLVNERRAETGA